MIWKCDVQVTIGGKSTIRSLLANSEAELKDKLVIERATFVDEMESFYDTFVVLDRYDD